MMPSSLGESDSVGWGIASRMGSMSTIVIIEALSGVLSARHPTLPFDHVVDKFHPFTHHPTVQINSPIIITSPTPKLFEGGSKICAHEASRRSCFSQ